MRLLLVVVLAAAVTTACDEDPARSLRIARAVGAPAATTLSAAAASHSVLRWSAAMCPSSAGTSGPSRFLGTGACAFERRESATCVLTDDDLLMKVAGPASSDGRLTVFVIVENYNKPRGRNQAKVVVSVETAHGLFRWRTASGHVTIGPDQKFVTFAEAGLTPVPPLDEQDIVVSGTLACASTVDAEDAAPRRRR